MELLLLEDDPVLSEILEEHLEGRGHKVARFYDGIRAEEAILSRKFDLLLLDVNVPGVDGFSLVEGLRRSGIRTPAIFLTSLTGSGSLKKGFAIGGNDYIRKPFELEELDARLDNLARTLGIGGVLELGEGFRFHPEEHWLEHRGGRTELRAKEGEILAYLFRNRGRTVSSLELMQNLWSYEEAPGDATIRTYIKNLRRVLGEERIANVRGQGYRFD